MGTRGSFIMRKGNAVKEAFIRWDAYPNGVGRDVLTLIKTVDLDRLFEQLMTEKEFFERFPKDKIPGGESQFFSMCKWRWGQVVSSAFFDSAAKAKILLTIPMC